MARALGFSKLWQNYQDARKVGQAVNPDGNRCALVLGMALNLMYKPRKEKGELSFRGIGQVKEGMRNQAVLDKFYVKAEDLALRLKEEWGQPDVKVVGLEALKTISGKTGIIFIENAWYTGGGFFLGKKTVDHIDVWDGTRTGAYSAEDSANTFKKADFVWLWIVH